MALKGKDEYSRTEARKAKEKLTSTLIESILKIKKKKHSITTVK